MIYLHVRRKKKKKKVSTRGQFYKIQVKIPSLLSFSCAQTPSFTSCFLLLLLLLHTFFFFFLKFIINVELITADLMVQRPFDLVSKLSNTFDFIFFRTTILTTTFYSWTQNHRIVTIWQSNENEHLNYVFFIIIQRNKKFNFAKCLDPHINSRYVERKSKAKKKTEDVKSVRQNSNQNAFD